MTFDPSAAFRRDLARWISTRRRPSASAATKLVVANPGVQAVLLLRAQMALQAAGRHRLARAASLHSLRIAGAQLLIGCRVGPGLRLPHPHRVVIGVGAVTDENWIILQRVTSGERCGDCADPRHGYPRLGARMVVGAGAAILGGVRVGDDAVVGANALVVPDVDAADVVVGVPARSTKKAGGAGQPHAVQSGQR